MRVYSPHVVGRPTDCCVVLVHAVLLWVVALRVGSTVHVLQHQRQRGLENTCRLHSHYSVPGWPICGNMSQLALSMQQLQPPWNRYSLMRGHAPGSFPCCRLLFFGHIARRTFSLVRG